jgi:hypothetical protein
MSEQKLIGIVLIVLSVMMIMLTKDGTPAAVFVPLGIYCLVTRNRIIGGGNAKKENP